MIVRDGVFVEYSTDGQAWSVVGAKGDASWYSSTALLGDNKLVGAFSGKINGWRLVSRKLDAAVGQARFWLRFRFVSGAAPATGGVLIDDVVISKVNFSFFLLACRSRRRARRNARTVEYSRLPDRHRAGRRCQQGSAAVPDQVEPCRRR